MERLETSVADDARSLSQRPEVWDGNRTVVAVILTWRGRVGLFKRSADVGHDAGLWHCITGFVEAGHLPLEMAVLELHEETGLGLGDLNELVAGEVLILPGSCGQNWQVHTFSARTERRRLDLNWEHTAYRWVRPAAIERFDGQVSWLGHVLGATGVVTP